MRVSLELRAIRELAHLLRPADRDGAPAGPVPRLGIVGHVDDREAAEVLLGLDVQPIGEDGRAAGRAPSTLHTTIDPSRPPSLKTQTLAAFISSITPLPVLPRSRSSCIVGGGLVTWWDGPGKAVEPGTSGA